MAFQIETFVSELRKNLDAFDLAGATSLCNDLITELMKSGEPFPSGSAEKIMQLLRNKRMFAAMQKVGDTFIHTGRASLKVQRQYAQAMIDQGNYTAALHVLDDIVAKTENNSGKDALAENFEAKGLIGRLYKQLYVNAESPKNPNSIHNLSLAANAYYDVYAKDRGKTWHGINTVAVLKRAQRDQITLTLDVDADELARRILNSIVALHDNEKADAWDFATAAEACLALGEFKEALRWLSGYARMPYCDAFELASTLRQLKEVWQLDLTSDEGKLLLPLLRSALMERAGGTLDLDADEIKTQSSLESKLDKLYEALVDKNLKVKGSNEIKLEKVFGDDSFKTYKWSMTMMTRCHAVARIGRDSTKGFGTGFLLKGRDLSPSLGDELVLLTNAHVVSLDPLEKSLRPDEAIVIFETLNKDEEFKDLAIIWSSPSTALDAAILRFAPEDRERLKNLTKDIVFYPVAKSLPVVETPSSQKVYVIGHPFGGTLQLSFQDNLLIDHDKIWKIHYRAPTEGGSSGSPVFNQQWQLIGLHHAGSDSMPCLNGKPGAYQANEGIWIQRIISELKSSGLSG